MAHPDVGVQLLCTILLCFLSTCWIFGLQQTEQVQLPNFKHYLPVAQAVNPQVQTPNTGNINMATTATTELIEFANFDAGDIAAWISLLQAQNITEFTLRFPVYTGSLSSTYRTVAIDIIDAAYAAGITVNIDFHTWNKTSNENSYPYTWSGRYADYGASTDSFCDEATNHEAIRASYLADLPTWIGYFDSVNGVGSYMVLNEPQAQVASTSENSFIVSCLTTAKAVTAKNVSVRFMAGYTPTSGYYSNAIWDNADFLAVNSYWDPLVPSTPVYGCTESKMNALIADASTRGKELWITEFGKTKTNLESQRIFVAGWVNYAVAKGIPKIFCWASQPSVAGENYNIFSGFTPNSAWYELGDAGGIGGEPPTQPVIFGLVNLLLRNR